MEPDGQYWPWTQGTTLEDEGQKLPAAHAEHTASELTVQAVWMNCPGHALQAEQTDALDVLAKVRPRFHGGQTVLAVALQLRLRYVPAAQTEQLAWAEEPERQ